MSEEPEVDVIVPVLDGGPRFAACLRSLLAQRDVQARIIVVDNGSGDGSRKVAEEAGVVVLDEPQRSSYAARNAGIAVATAPVVAFTDADCLADPYWLRHGLDALEGNRWDLCAGAVRQEPGTTLAGRHDELAYLRQDVNVGKMGFGATANLFVRREVFTELGRFDGSVQSGGDLQFGRLAVASGKSLGYAEDAVVHHPPRDRLGPVLKKAWRIGTGHANACQRDPSLLGWALSPRGLLPSRVVLRRAWRAPGVVVVDTLVKWTTWTARAATIARMAAVRRARPASGDKKPVVMVSSWWPTDSAPHQAPFILDHALAVHRAGGEVWCWAVVPGLRMRTGRPLGHRGLVPRAVATKAPRVPRRLSSRAVGRWLLAVAGWLQGRPRRGRLGPVVVQSCDYAGPYAVGLAGGAKSPLLYLEHWSAVALRELSRGERKSLRLVARRADVPIAVSPNLAQALEEIGALDAGRTRIVDNPVDPSIFFPAPPAPHEGLHLVQVADFRAVKGHDLLVDALVALGAEVERLDLRVTLVGDGPERVRIRRRVDACGLTDRVRFTGKLSRAEIAELMRGADWTLLTSRTENAPCVVSESLCVGRPVIAPRTGGLEWMLREGDGIVYDRSPAGLVAALRQAAQGDPGSWQGRASAAADRWAPDAVARSWYQLLDEVGAA